MKSLKIIFSLVILTSLVSCNNKRQPQVQYMNDMYVSVPYDADAPESINGNPSANLKPVAGTIARGGVAAYDIPDTNEGYEKAKTELKNPFEVDEANMANGKKMYDIYCAVCHGKKGDGNGILTQREKFAGIPNYKDRDITEGSIYHVLMHGKNLMGSHSSQLTAKERWQVVMYVQKLKEELK